MPSDYSRIEKAIYWIERHFVDKPELADLADLLDLSVFHTQRLFKRWAGITPNQFLQFVSVNFAKHLLDDSRSILDAAYGAGYSGPGRLHDQMVNVEAVSPGEYKFGGRGIRIFYGFHDSPFGEYLIAVTRRGICHLSFVLNAMIDDNLQTLERQWPKADLYRDQNKTRDFACRIFLEHGNRETAELKILLRGTNFQIKVWEALLRIPQGCIAAYGDVAASIGHPTSSRAVGSAVGSNPIAFLIPCHRVIRSSGIIGNYRWGKARKKAMIAWETAGKKETAGSNGPQTQYTGLGIGKLK